MRWKSKYGTPFFLIWIIGFLVSSCYQEEYQYPPEQTHMFLQVKAGSFSAENTDRINEIRMMIFDAATKATVYNDLLYFPAGFTETSDTIEIIPATYDFVFIGNESSYPGLTNVLADISNKFQLETDQFLNRIQFDRNFSPTTSPFLLSAQYDNETIVGGPKANPEHFKGPDFRIQLLRSLAKVDLTFKKEPDVIITKRLTSIQLKNIPRYYVLPAHNRFYSAQFGTNDLIDDWTIPVSFPEIDYTKDSIGHLSFYIPEFLRRNNNDPLPPTQLVFNLTDQGTNSSKTFVLEDTFQGVEGHARPPFSAAALNKESVVRNTLYKLNVTLLSSPFDVDIYYQITDWSETMINSSTVLEELHVDKRTAYMENPVQAGQHIQRSQVIYFNSKFRYAGMEKVDQDDTNQYEVVEAIAADGVGAVTIKSNTPIGTVSPDRFIYLKFSADGVSLVKLRIKLKFL